MGGEGEAASVGLSQDGEHEGLLRTWIDLPDLEALLCYLPIPSSSCFFLLLSFAYFPRFFASSPVHP